MKYNSTCFLHEAVASEPPMHSTTGSLYHPTVAYAHSLQNLYHLPCPCLQMVDYAVATVEAKYNSAGERQVGIVRLNGLLHPDEHTVFKVGSKGRVCQMLHFYVWHWGGAMCIGAVLMDGSQDA